MSVNVGENLISLNDSTLSLNFGVFHAGVEIDGVEYSFGWCEDGTGVYSCTPKDSPGYHFRTTVEMGDCVLTRAQINQLLSRMVKEWTGPSYSTLGRNCCTFSNELCVGLRVGEIPPWINNLASTFAPSRKRPRLGLGLLPPPDDLMYSSNTRVSFSPSS